MERKEIIQIVFLIILFITVLSLIYTTITIVKYKDMLNNPLGYSLDKFEISSCICQDNYGQIMQVDSISKSNHTIEINNTLMNSNQFILLDNKNLITNRS